MTVKNLQYVPIYLEVYDPVVLATPAGDRLAVEWGPHAGTRGYAISSVDRRMLRWHRLAPDDKVVMRGKPPCCWNLPERCAEPRPVYYWDRIEPFILPGELAGIDPEFYTRFIYE